jgi:epoxyqueuosine reductase QueG
VKEEVPDAKALTAEFKHELKEAGAYLAGIADPRRGFEHEIEKGHIFKAMPECRSVVVFGVAVGDGELSYNNRYFPLVNDEGYIKRKSRLTHYQRAYVGLHGVQCLNGEGFRARMERNVQCKLCAYEAGLGVYGRSSVIVTPELGPRVGWGVILTDAELLYDERLKDFNPCENCRVCVRACGGGAIGGDGRAGGSFDREACKRYRGFLEEKGHYCHSCLAECPRGKNRLPVPVEDRQMIPLHLQAAQVQATIRTEWADSCRARREEQRSCSGSSK